MNRNRLLMIGVFALTLGAFVSYFAYQSLKAKSSSEAQAGVDVVVANDELQVGSKIEINDVIVVRYPVGNLPPDYFKRKSDVLGRGVIQTISRGDFILPAKLADAKAGSGLPALIPAGMRAVSVRVNEVVSVAGFVQPGTRVDVLVTGNPSNASEQQTTTVLENVLVLASGPNLERDSAGRALATPVITLAVSPDDAQKLTLASTDGRIQLSLRNPTDTKQGDLNAVSTSSLYRHGPAPLPIVAPKRTPRPVVLAPPPPAVYSVQVIKGTTKDETKFPQQTQ